MIAITVMRAAKFALFPLTVRQLAVLLYLGRSGETLFRDLREDLGFTPPILTRAADTLVRVGWLARVASKDKRVPLLSLTPEGQAFVDQVEHAVPTADRRLPITGEAPKARRP